MQRARDIVQGVWGRSVEGWGGCEGGSRQRWQNSKLNHKLLYAIRCQHFWFGDKSERTWRFWGGGGGWRGHAALCFWREHAILPPREKASEDQEVLFNTKVSLVFLLRLFSTTNNSGFQKYPLWQAVVSNERMGRFDNIIILFVNVTRGNEWRQWFVKKIWSLFKKLIHTMIFFSGYFALHLNLPISIWSDIHLELLSKWTWLNVGGNCHSIWECCSKYQWVKGSHICWVVCCHWLVLWVKYTWGTVPSALQVTRPELQ